MHIQWLGQQDYCYCKYKFPLLNATTEVHTYLCRCSDVVLKQVATSELCVTVFRSQSTITTVTNKDAVWPMRFIIDKTHSNVCMYNCICMQVSFIKEEYLINTLINHQYVKHSLNKLPIRLTHETLDCAICVLHNQTSGVRV